MAGVSLRAAGSAALIALLLAPSAGTAQKSPARGAKTQGEVNGVLGFVGKSAEGNATAPSPPVVEAPPRTSSAADGSTQLDPAGALVASGKYREAIAELDKIEPGIPAALRGRWRQSAGAGVEVLRAIALHKLGQHAEGEAQFAAVEARRTWSPSYMRLVRLARMYVETDPARQFEIVRNAAALDPAMFKPLFWFAVMEGRFADAMEVAPHMSFDLARKHGGWQSAEEDTARYEQIVERARFEGAVVYLLAATGQSDAANARAAALRQDIDESDAPPAVPNPGPEARADHNRRKESAASARKLLGDWERAIALRATLKGKSFAAADPLLRDLKVPASMVVLDLFRQVVAADAFERARLEAVFKDLRREATQLRDELLLPKMKAILESVPEIEDYERRPEMKREGGFLGDGNNGFKVSPDKQAGIVHVRFGSTTGSPAMIEEAAMLAAASYARSKKNDCFVLTSFTIMKRSTRIYTAYSSYSSHEVDSGYEVRLTMRMANSAALPADLAGAPWRLIRVEPLIAKLGAVYGAVKS